MSRRTTITDEQILEAARTVFLSEGYGAQTSKIAREAGISEGTIFKRFPTKEALFIASLDLHLEAKWHRLAKDLTVDWQGLEGLTILFEELLSFFNDLVPRMMTVFGSAMRAESPIWGDADSPRQRDQKILSALFQAQIDAGRMRKVDPEDVANLIMGAMIHHVIVSMELRKPLTPTDIRNIASTTVDLIWSGIKAS
jgi:AcrR family transcriptional regulator